MDNEYNIHDTEPGKRQQCLPLVVCLLLLQMKWGYHLCTYNVVKTETQLINNHSTAAHLPCFKYANSSFSNKYIKAFCTLIYLKQNDFDYFLAYIICSHVKDIPFTKA